MTNESSTEHGYKWWIRYVIVPLFGTGGAIALLVAFITHLTTPSPYESGKSISIPTPIVYNDIKITLTATAEKKERVAIEEIGEIKQIDKKVSGPVKLGNEASENGGFSKKIQTAKRSSSSLNGTLYLSHGKILPFSNLHISSSDTPDILVAYDQETSNHTKKGIDLREVSKIIFRDKKQTSNGSFAALEITYKNGKTDLTFAGLYDAFVASSPNRTEQKEIPFYEIEQIKFQ